MVSRIVWMAVAVFSMAPMAAPASDQAKVTPRIELVEFDVEPAVLNRGDSFVLRARAVATDVPLGSFLLRTAEEVPREDKIPGFPLYASGKYYLAEDGTYLLKDNGKLDQDPRQHAFALEVSTKGWKEGGYTFAFFASRRPSEGPFVAARHDFAVGVRGDQVRIEDLGPIDVKRSRSIAMFAAEPSTVEPDDLVTITARIRSRGFQGIRITNPFPIDAADALPGFVYDATKKKSFYGTPSEPLVIDGGDSDRDPASGTIVVEMTTKGWPSGVHHFLLEVVGISGAVIDHRSFAVKIPGPHDQLDVTVEDSYYFAPGTHFGRFVKVCDGTLLCSDEFSPDGGRVWKQGTGGFGVGGQQLADGSILGLEYKSVPEKDNDGWYLCEKSLSTDDGRNFEKGWARMFVPEAKPAMGHGYYEGPIFMRSIVERVDGSLIALMAGWFKSDTAPCPYGRGRPYSRSYVCDSDDGGETWRYLCTIGYAHIGSEGYNEGSMRRLPNGELLVVLRTRNERDFACQDNPIMWSTSSDEGRTWSPPKRTSVEGSYPSLTVLSDGLIVMGYGRPGAMVVFSADHGRTWTDHTAVDVTPYSGYTDVVELGPGEILVGFGAKDYLDPTSFNRESQLRFARVRYKRKPQ